jgi:hypothetical protein
MGAIIIIAVFIAFTIIIANALSKSARAREEKKKLEKQISLAKLTAERQLDIINESLEIISKTKNLSTLISRYDTIIDNVDKLIKIAEDYNCPDLTEPPPQALKEKFLKDRESKIKSFILDQVDFEIEKAKAITKKSSKISILDKAIVMILEGKRLINDEETEKILDNKEAEIRQLIEAIQNS